jgi:hypothetical protein
VPDAHNSDEHRGPDWFVALVFRLAFSARAGEILRRQVLRYLKLA